MINCLTEPAAIRSLAPTSRFLVRLVISEAPHLTIEWPCRNCWERTGGHPSSCCTASTRVHRPSFYQRRRVQEQYFQLWQISCATLLLRLTAHKPVVGPTHFITSVAYITVALTGLHYHQHPQSHIFLQCPQLEHIRLPLRTACSAILLQSYQLAMKLFIISLSMYIWIMVWRRTNSQSLIN